MPKSKLLTRKATYNHQALHETTWCIRNIQSSYVIIVDEQWGKFAVRSKQDANKVYGVSFGTEIAPKRSCEILGQINKHDIYRCIGWQDSKLLGNLNFKLKKCYEFLKDSAPKENAIIFELQARKHITVNTVCFKHQSTAKHS